MQKKKYKQIDIKQKHLNLIAYLINQFAVDSCSMDKDFLNVVDTKTQKRTEDFEYLNPSNIVFAINSRLYFIGIFLFFSKFNILSFVNSLPFA